jgi:hypothetical protein
MARFRLLVIPFLVTLTLLLSSSASHANPSYENAVTLHLPPTASQLTSWDISFVDTSTSTLAFTDRNNKSLDVFDTQDNRFVRLSDPVFFGIATTSGKTGAGKCPSRAAGDINQSNPNNGGPNGVVIISNRSEDEERGNQQDLSLSSLADVGHVVLDDQDQRNRGQGWTGDGDSTVKVIDLTSGKQIGGSIDTGGLCRADELWNDPRDQEVMIGNPSDPTVFETFISTSGSPGPQSVKGKLIFDGSGLPCADAKLNSVTIRVCHTDKSLSGIEQPIFALDHFWVAIGSTGKHPNGEVMEIDPKTFEHVADIDVPCSPSGLTLVSDHEAAAACGAGVQFLNLSTLSVDGAPVAETGGADEIWYANGNVYAPDSNAVTGCANNVVAIVGAHSPTPPAASVTPAQANSCLAVIAASTKSVLAEVQLPADSGSHSVAADARNQAVFVPVKDSTCSTGTPCPPTASVTPCAVLEDGAAACVHDQGVAVIVQGP